MAWLRVVRGLHPQHDVDLMDLSHHDLDMKHHGLISFSSLF